MPHIDALSGWMKIFSEKKSYVHASFLHTGQAFNWLSNSQYGNVWLSKKLLGHNHFSLAVSFILVLVFFPLFVVERSLRKGQLRRNQGNPRPYLSLSESVFLKLYFILNFFYFQIIYILCIVDLTVLMFPIFSNPIAFNIAVFPQQCQESFLQVFFLLLFQLSGGFGCWEVKNCWVDYCFQFF